MNKTNNTQLATKEDLKKLATHKALKQVEKNVRGEILRVEERVESLEDKVENLGKKVGGLEKKVDSLGGKVENLEDGQKRIETKIDTVINTLDSFVGRLESLETENEIGAHQTRQLEVRVTKLESSSQTP